MNRSRNEDRYWKELNRLMGRTYKAEASYKMWRERLLYDGLTGAARERAIIAEDKAYSRMIDAANAEHHFATHGLKAS